MANQIPIVDYLALDDGPPHLVAWEAVGSGALYFDRRNADAKAGGTDFRRRKLGTTGKLRSFTIVHRTVPGVPAPYVSSTWMATTCWVSNFPVRWSPPPGRESRPLDGKLVLQCEKFFLLKNSAMSPMYRVLRAAFDAPSSQLSS